MSSTAEDRPLLIVFAKRPEPGQVKTRLCPPFTEEQAAAFYACLLEDVLDVTASMGAELGAALRLCIHPADAVSEPGVPVPPGFEIVPQRGDDLSARMEDAFASAAADGFSPVLIRGSDSPALDLRTVRQAIVALERADVALCPDLDGGYNLVGLRNPVPRLFDHAMSTERVLQDTVERAHASGRTVALLPKGFDIDTAGDLEHLQHSARAMRTCSRTVAYLDRNQLWPSAQGRTPVA